MDWGILSAVGSFLGGIAAAVAVVFAGFQIRHSRIADEQARAREIDGVAVSWVTVESPDHPEADGNGRWLLDLRIDNPSSLPIDDVRAVVHFETPVARVRYSGRTEPPASMVELYAPVIAAHGHRLWTRRLSLDFDARDTLDMMRAVVKFRGVDGREHENTWPRITT